MNSSIIQRLTLLVFLIFTVWLSFYIIQPPQPKPASSSKTEFSAERAFKHVQQIAKVPHPVGSAANDSARNYIIDELQKLGLQPIVQDGIGVGTSYDLGLVANTKNIIAKKNATDPQKTILLMAHYDSTPSTLGAADDASGTAAVLETIRAIQSQETPLQNNVWILITDGEERGLLGAELFTNEFAELDSIDLILNVEARGTSGPSFMFETSAPNGKLITNFAEATKYPVANSLMYTVYKMLPNDTDLSVTKRAGLKGLNFAFTKDFLNYHTLQDNPQNLSLASLQHHGSNLLDNVRHFGNGNYDLESKTEYVYFNNATGGLMYYPSGWSFPLALVTTLLFIAYLVFLFRTNQLSLGKYLGSILLFIGMTVLSALATYFGWQLLKGFNPQVQWLIQTEVYNHHWYFWGFTLLNLGVFSAIYSWFQKKMSTQQLISGSFTIWILLSLASAWYLPTASYVFTWPVLMALIGWIVLGNDITETSWKTIGVLAISLFAVLYMLPPYIHLIQVMLTTEMLAASMALLALVLGLSWPLAWQVIRDQKQVISWGLTGIALIFFVGASMNSGFNEHQKKQNSINYVLNQDTNKAYWTSRDDTTDFWTRQFFRSDYQKGVLPEIDIPRSSRVLYRSATLVGIPKPTFEVTSDSTSDSLRHLNLKLNAGQGIAMIMRWNDANLSEVGIHGKKVFGQEDMQQQLYYFQDLSEDVEVNLSYPTSQENPSLEFTFLDPGLPTELISNYQERPSDTMPPPFPVFMSDATVWHTTVGLNEMLSSQ